MADGKIVWQQVADDSQLMKDLDGTTSKVEGKLGGFGDAAKKIGAAVGGAFAVKQVFEWGSAFETSLAGASTLFGDARVDMQGLSSDMLALSDRTGIAADQLGGALYNALSAGVPASDDMSEALDFLESSTKLAAAGFTDIDTAQSATIKTLNAYKMDISEADKIQKILIQTQNKGITTVGELGSVLAQVTPTAAAMNVSFEQVGAGIANMTAQGTPAAQATTQLNSLFAELGKQGTQAQKNLMAAAEGTKHAGKSFQDLMAEGVPLNEVLDMMKGYADENGLSMLDMFSSIEAGKAALANSGQNAAAFTEALSAMSTETDVVGEAFDKVANTSAYKFNELMNQLKNVAIDLFLVFAPILTQILPVLADLFQQLIGPLMELVERILTPLLEILMAILDPLFMLISAILPPLFTLIDELLAPIFALLDLLKQLIDFVVGVFTGQWSESWQEVGKIFTELWNSLTTFLSDTWDKIWSRAKEVWDRVFTFFSDTWNRVKRTAENVFNALRNFFEGVLGTISGVFRNTVGRVKGFIDDLRSGIDQAISGIRSIFQGLSDFISGVFTGNWQRAWDGIKGIFGGAFDAMVGLMKAPVNWIISGLNTFISGLNRIRIPSWVPGVGGKGISLPTIPSLKVGMEYVPADDYPALLHAGEAVLTKEQADRWRHGMPRFENMHQYAFAGSQAVTVHNQMVGTVEMDGYTVGKVVLRNLDDVRGMNS